MIDRTPIFATLLAALVLCTHISWVCAQEKGTPGKAATEKARPGSAKETAITAEKVAEVEQFVSHHHSELGELLRQLKETNQAQYEKAIRELLAANQRLKTWQATDPERYDLELKAWKLTSRVQLLAAKVSMMNQEELKQELRSTIAEQQTVRHSLLLLDRERLQERLKKIDKEIADSEVRREATVQKQFDALTSKTSLKKTDLKKPDLKKPEPPKNEKKP